MVSELKQGEHMNKHTPEWEAVYQEMLEELKTFDLYIRNNESGEHGQCKICDLIAKAEGKGA